MSHRRQNDFPRVAEIGTEGDEGEHGSSFSQKPFPGEDENQARVTKAARQKVSERRP